MSELLKHIIKNHLIVFRVIFQSFFFVKLNTFYPFKQNIFIHLFLSCAIKNQGMISLLKRRTHWIIKTSNWKKNFIFIFLIMLTVFVLTYFFYNTNLFTHLCSNLVEYFMHKIVIILYYTTRYHRYREAKKNQQHFFYYVTVFILFINGFYQCFLFSNSNNWVIL